jgi:AcrR family transcriptional regulator
MARPKSDDKRSAIISAAVKAIAVEGLAASTASIAKEAGVSNGSLFTYFETKADLLNQLYIELKTEMGAAAMDRLPAGAGDREQLLHVWEGWLHWATTSPYSRRALACLDISDQITAQTHKSVSEGFDGIRALLERCREHGPMRGVSLMFVLSLMTAVAEATIDFMLRDPGNAKQHSEAGFEALWRILA